MNQVIEKFSELSSTKRGLLWGGTLLIVTFVFWQYFYKAQFEEYGKLTEEVEKLNGLILEQRRIVRNLPKFREEIDELDAKLNVVLQELPDKSQIETLLNSISVLAIDSGLEVTQFATQREELREFVAARPVNIELEGTFHQLATFFDEVAHLSRVVNVDNIEIVIVQENEKEVIIRARCKATSFRYLEEGDRITPKSKSKDGRRRSRSA